MRNTLMLAFSLIAVGGTEAAQTILVSNPVTVAQISPSVITLPGATFPALLVQGDTTPGGQPSRIVMEFAMPAIGSALEIDSAFLDIVEFGGIRASGALEYRLYGYSGTGALDLTTGLTGQEAAGPFTYDIDFAGADLSNLNVTGFVRSLVGTGATHIGFSFRDSNTAPNFRTDGQYLVVQDSPSWGGDVPPTLTITQIPEPGVLAYLLLIPGLFLRRAR